MTPNLRDIAAIQAELLKRRATQSLRVFVEWAWPILEPETPFQSNWHIDFLIEYLEAVSAGEIRRLVINIPPRYGKSLLVSVLWPCWEWIREPSRRWIFVSYTEALASRHSLDRRRLLTDRSYQRCWGEIVRLTRDQQAKTAFENTHRGIMVATSVGGSVTGMGGNRLILDDPHNPTQAESDTQREHAISFYRETLSTRLDDPERDAMVLVMQRLHARDLAAVCIDQGFTHVSLPALAPTRTTIVFPRSGRTIVRERDEPLWEARQNRASLEEQRLILGIYGFAGQYQQEPVPRSGGMFDRTWWQWYDVPPSRFDDVIQSWDLTYKDGDSSDYVVALIAGRVGAQVYILERFKKKISFVETLAAIRSMRVRYPGTNAVLVEDAANGAAVVNVLQREIPGIIPVRPEGSKFARAAAVQPRVEAGQVFLPRPRGADGRITPERAWVDDFVENCALFPKGEHDDDVDALTQLLLRRYHRTGVVTNRDILRAHGPGDNQHTDDDGSGGLERPSPAYSYRKFRG